MLETKKQPAERLLAQKLAVINVILRRFLLLGYLLPAVAVASRLSQSQPLLPRLQHLLQDLHLQPHPSQTPLFRHPFLQCIPQLLLYDLVVIVVSVLATTFFSLSFEGEVSRPNPRIFPIIKTLTKTILAVKSTCKTNETVDRTRILVQNQKLMTTICFQQGASGEANSWVIVFYY